MLNAFLVSAGVVALAEVGDKTQLLSLVLAARYRRPLPIVLGVLVATLVNHAAAGAVGALLSHLLSREVLEYVMVASFVAMAVWILIPDRFDESDLRTTGRPLGIFATTVVAFFIAEMGDKTQVATVALAAQFHDLAGVVAGTTVGMMLANVPAIYLGHRFADRLPTRTIHCVAAGIMLALAGVALWNVARGRALT